MISIRSTFDDAHRSPDFSASLLAGVQDLVGSGAMPREAAYADLLELYQELDSQGCEADRDAVADVLDRLVGWCAPSARI